MCLVTIHEAERTLSVPKRGDRYISQTAHLLKGQSAFEAVPVRRPRCWRALLAAGLFARLEAATPHFSAGRRKNPRDAGATVRILGAADRSELFVPDGARDAGLIAPPNVGDDTCGSFRDD